MKTSIFCFVIINYSLLVLKDIQYTHICNTMIYKEMNQKPPCSAGGGVGPLVWTRNWTGCRRSTNGPCASKGFRVPAPRSRPTNLRSSSCTNLRRTLLCQPMLHVWWKELCSNNVYASYWCAKQVPNEYQTPNEPNEYPVPKNQPSSQLECTKVMCIISTKRTKKFTTDLGKQ